ncbi:arginine--tRNA ligase [Geobacter hydrogenophilus]|uniref:Arginine--tRNA ligase n=1 Tax=Geobacter hydrogenophilus TaxID=40983 RepID=A0A9W6G2G2_9BACT|nr:arginine--tRNA ligase [Geobacter hydrogenophilus]MBT0892991.1 arginine--tRNA ligase [Geobacter hydrogenophilus]GLI39174.1 arginine--tRNA ligase [Geobacter hydrogenophilus]
MKDRVRSLVAEGIERCFADGSLASNQMPAIVIEKPAHAEHGDFACTVAMSMAKAERKAPRVIAETIVKHIENGEGGIIGEIDIAGPGFINFRIKNEAWSRTLVAVEAAGANFGRSCAGEGHKVQVEFVSANPTGPLHIGHGRGAAIGDTICRLLSASGFDVTREFYYNDAGAQIANLALSVQARCLGIEPGDPRWPADGYQGDYIKDVARSYLNRETVDAGDQHVTAAGDPNDLDAIRRFAVAYLRREQDQDLLAFDVHFDVYSLESSLYTEGRVEEVVRRLIENGHTFEQDGALWLRTTDFGDDKDRVMRKSDGSYTYFVPDVAYHLAKWERGFTRVINEQGADHHSTITRVRAGLQALNAGIPQEWPEYVLHQMVTVMRGGEEVKISKRAGSYVTLRDLIDEVGRDATRFFFLMRKPDSQLVFDIDLAKQQSLENPVYYVQYAHARICSIFEAACDRGISVPSFPDAHVYLLGTPEEIELIKLIGSFPEVIEGSALSFEPHRITYYLQELAGAFHSFYNKNRVIGEEKELSSARLFLLKCVAQVLKNGLALLGVSAPEKM